MLKWTIRALVVFALALSAEANATIAQAPETVVRLDMVGNRRVGLDTTLSLIHTRPGDAYDPKTLLQDLETLEHSKYFESVQLGIEDEPSIPNGKIVIFHLVERPAIYSIEYNGLDSVSPSEIADRFKGRNVDLSVGGLFNPEALDGAQTAIREVLAKHGYTSAQVKVSFESVRRENAVNLTFTVTEGPANYH